jgi:cation transport regulator ChaB
MAKRDRGKDKREAAEEVRWAAVKNNMAKCELDDQLHGYAVELAPRNAT